MELTVLDDLSSTELAESRSKVLELEHMLLDMPQIEIPVTHHLHGGMYMREITIPKGTMVTGDIYKFDHFDVMISGDITVTSNTGEAIRLTGFNVYKGLRGKKRAAYTHEDTTWMTIHPYSGKTGDEVQEFVTVKSFSELEGDKKWLES